MDRHLSLTTYDLVSHGKNVEGHNECWGALNDGKGWGPSYQYNCIHSDIIRVTGDIATSWYNYALASAGTITDTETTSSDPATNTITAIESVCPKGWTLPSKTQIDSQRNVNSFSPVLGGYYSSSNIQSESTYGFWWGSEAYAAPSRHVLRYNGDILYTGNNYYRHDGAYIRCVQKST